MAVDPPWMYSAEQRNGSRFPTTTFDPKAVTRASWEPKPRKPKQDGPLVSFNRHPDAQMVIRNRSNPYKPMGRRTKSCIKWLRRVQLGLRLIQLNGAIGILALMVLLTKVDASKGWVMRIAPGIVICHCVYAIYHLSRDAAGRTPNSSAAYQVFAAMADVTTMGFYAFSALTTHNESGSWSNRLSGAQDLTDVFSLALYYSMVGAGGLHLLSLCFSLWLAWAFRRISLMPPDMNPLEDNLTARPRHKRNKSSMTTLSSTESEKRLSTPLGSRPGSGTTYDSSSRPTVPFMHTREGSSVSVGTRDSRINLPSRQYQIVPGNSPRNSVASVETKRLSRPLSALRGSYAEVPLEDPSAPGNKSPVRDSAGNGRAGKFTETWAPTDSLVSRTNQRNRNAAAASRGGNQANSYAALPQRYGLEDASDSEYDDENVVVFGDDNEADLAEAHHPSPLRSNPLPGSRTITNRTQTPFSPTSVPSAEEDTLSEMSPNRRRVSESKDIADETTTMTPSKGQKLRRNPSIQPESAFYSKPYGQLKSAAPPIMIGGDRKASSGNDYDSHKYLSTPYERRNVSGKVAEEGRAGDRVSRFGHYLGGR